MFIKSKMTRKITAIFTTLFILLGLMSMTLSSSAAEDESLTSVQPDKEVISVKPDEEEKPIKEMEVASSKVKEAVSKGEIKPIYDFVNVAMKNKYSFPEKMYTAEDFDTKYAKSIEVLSEYKEGTSKDKDNFHLMLSIYLTDYGKEHFDEYLKILNARDDVYVAEQDFTSYNVTDEKAQETQPAKTNSKNTTSVPQTGDSSSPVFLLIVSVLSSAAFIGTVIIPMKRKKED